MYVCMYVSTHIETNADVKIYLPYTIDNKVEEMKAVTENKRRKRQESVI
jgi:hypothetical protein